MAASRKRKKKDEAPVKALPLQDPLATPLGRAVVAARCVLSAGTAAEAVAAAAAAAAAGEQPEVVHAALFRACFAADDAPPPAEQLRRAQRYCRVAEARDWWPHAVCSLLTLDVLSSAPTPAQRAAESLRLCRDACKDPSYDPLAVLDAVPLGRHESAHAPVEIKRRAVAGISAGTAGDVMEGYATWFAPCASALARSDGENNDNDSDNSVNKNSSNKTNYNYKNDNDNSIDNNNNDSNCNSNNDDSSSHKSGVDSKNGCAPAAGGGAAAAPQAEFLAVFAAAARADAAGAGLQRAAALLQGDAAAPPAAEPVRRRLRWLAAAAARRITDAAPSSSLSATLRATASSPAFTAAPPWLLEVTLTLFASPRLVDSLPPTPTAPGEFYAAVIQRFAARLGPRAPLLAAAVLPKRRTPGAGEKSKAAAGWCVGLLAGFGDASAAWEPGRDGQAVLQTVVRALAGAAAALEGGAAAVGGEGAEGYFSRASGAPAATAVLNGLTEARVETDPGFCYKALAAYVGDPAGFVRAVVQFCRAAPTAVPAASALLRFLRPVYFASVASTLTELVATCQLPGPVVSVLAEPEQPTADVPAPLHAPRLGQLVDRLSVLADATAPYPLPTLLSLTAAVRRLIRSQPDGCDPFPAEDVAHEEVRRRNADSGGCRPRRPPEFLAPAPPPLPPAPPKRPLSPARRLTMVAALRKNANALWATRWGRALAGGDLDALEALCETLDRACRAMLRWCGPTADASDTLPQAIAAAAWQVPRWSSLERCELAVVEGKGKADGPSEPEGPRGEAEEEGKQKSGKRKRDGGEESNDGADLRPRGETEAEGKQSDREQPGGDTAEPGGRKRKRDGAEESKDGADLRPRGETEAEGKQSDREQPGGDTAEPGGRKRKRDGGEESKDGVDLRPRREFSEAVVWVEDYASCLALPRGKAKKRALDELADTAPDPLTVVLDLLLTAVTSPALSQWAADWLGCDVHPAERVVYPVLSGNASDKVRLVALGLCVVAPFSGRLTAAALAGFVARGLGPALGVNPAALVVRSILVAAAVAPGFDPARAAALTPAKQLPPQFASRIDNAIADTSALVCALTALLEATVTADADLDGAVAAFEELCGVLLVPKATLPAVGLAVQRFASLLASRAPDDCVKNHVAERLVLTIEALSESPSDDAAEVRDLLEAVLSNMRPAEETAEAPPSATPAAEKEGDAVMSE
ncbi:hypothetical protein DIPPA_34452 [Diplonema papillatum]|nr:hypothetical protein DIPPA_34452 [Diplonema papillatum]